MEFDQPRAEPDPSFDRFTRMIRDALGAPVALVTIVEADRQIFPGSTGLPEPWSSSRQTPLAYSFCQYVVADQAPLIVTDARTDPRLQESPAIDELSVIAYAGYPLRAPSGAVVGSVCAIHTTPHEWTESELRFLADLSEACGAELALRESRAALRESAAVATELTRRARLLLSLSEALAETVTLTDIAMALRTVSTRYLDCVQAGVWIVTGGARDQLRFVEHPDKAWAQAGRYALFDVSVGNPVGAALVARKPLYFADFAEQAAQFPAFGPGSGTGDLGARAILPLVASGRPLATLVLTWAESRSFTVDDRITIAALASYAGQAVSRAELLAERTGVAHTLQHALLTHRLPEVAGLDLQARYRAASEHDEVGGDWYDANVLPSGAVAVTIGDVEGHDVFAAATMGSLRSMLRALAWAFDDAPSATVRRLDQAVRDLLAGTHATLVFGRISAHGDGFVLTWTNAGHPLPLLLDPGGRCELLGDRRNADRLLGVTPDRERHDRTTELPPGATLLLYTDGLVEAAGLDVDTGLDRLRAAVERHRSAPLGRMLDLVLDDVVGPQPADDVAVLGLRVAAASGR